MFEMQSPLNRYIMLIRRWAWMIVLGIVICGGITYVVSKLTSPTYQASAIFVINVDATSSTNATSSIAAVPTYAQLLTNPLVLDPVAAQNKGLNTLQLNAMMTVKPQTNTQLIELDVQNNDPHLAAQLANEVGQSFIKYANSQLPGTVQMLPAQVPGEPIKPQPSHDAGIGALIGLGLALTLMFIFEWIEDRLSNPDEVQELLGMDLLAVIPQLPESQRKSLSKGSAPFIEKYRMLAASLNSAQAINPYKLVMITSALAGEGKSTVAANLASFLAMTGKRVLLIDANLRHPVLDQRFQVDGSRGLSNVFIEMWNSPRRELYGQETNIPTLRVLASGGMLTEPAELLQSPLASQIFDYLKESPFDYIIVDSPPLLPVADAQVMASLVEAVVLVIDANKTPRRVLVRARQVLRKTQTRVLGVVINKSKWLDLGVSQQYPEKRRQTQENHLRLPYQDTPSHYNMLAPPRMPLPDNINLPSHVPSPFMGRPVDTPRLLIRPPFVRNEELNTNNTVMPGNQEEQMDMQGKAQNMQRDPRAYQ
jgi:succinoglycan biosynthesis transport protein ExoP